MAGNWLEDILTQLQGGGAPAAFQPAASPFPDMPKPPDEAALAADAREAAGARLIRSNQRRVDPFGMPDVNSAGIQLGLEQVPAGTGVPVQGSPQFVPFGMPPSMAAAKEMAAPPPPAPPAAGPPGSIGGAAAMVPPQLPPPTDISAQSRPPAPAPMSLAPAMPPVAAPETSFMDTLKGFAPALLGAGAALQGDGGALTASILKDREAKALLATNKNATARALLGRGAPAEEVNAAVNNPELLKALIGKYFETGKPLVVGGHVVRERPGGALEVLGDFSKDEVAKNDAARLGAGYQWVDPNDKSKGATFIPGGSADPKVKADNAKVGEPPKYAWVDPNDHSKGQYAIPGGGAEKIAPEVAARVGLARSFLGQLPDIKRDIAKGDATGPWDAAMAKIGAGRPGEIRRQIESGAEALLRNLTGAGMNVSEAQKYISRYELQPWDTTASVKSKLTQLERELNYTIAEVEKGRSTAGAPIIDAKGNIAFVGSGARTAAPAAGVVDIGGQKLKWSVN